MFNTTRRANLCLVIAAGAGLAVGAVTAEAAYSDFGLVPIASPGIYIPITEGVPDMPTYYSPSGPDSHPGKEYSTELDRDALGQMDDRQVIAWGSGTSTADTFDYGVTGAQVDALANIRDAFFDAVIENRTPALFSLRVLDQGVPDDATLTGAVDGDPIYFETADGSTDTWAKWFPGPTPEYNLDGLEVWGPEGTWNQSRDDANMYSLFDDSAHGCSVYFYDDENASSACYISLNALAAVVIPFLEAELQSTLTADQIDLDAMMVFDLLLFDDPWVNGDAWEDGDRLLFSLWPVTGTLVGDLAMVWTNGVGVEWFNHGGHEWNDGWLGVNVDALEAAAPEPGTMLLATFGVGLLGWRRRRSLAS